jgi:nucleoredoxin
MRKVVMFLGLSVVLGAVAFAVESAGWAKDLFGETLVKRDKTTVATSTLDGKSKVAIYFSAHWCPPCRMFTPKLVEAYNKAKADGAAVELVFVSSDQDEEKMYAYMNESKMDWLAVPYDGPRRKLGEKYGVRGIPTLVILDAEGKVITKDGRAAVMSKGAEALK